MTAATSIPEIGTAARTANQAEVVSQARNGLMRAFGVGISVLGLAAGIAGMVYLLILGLAWYNTPFLGVLTSPALTINEITPLGSESWNGLQVGLHAGDRITAITSDSGANTTFEAGDPTAAAKLFDVLGSLHRGQIIDVTVERPLRKVFQRECSGYSADGAICDYSVTLGQFPLADFFGQFGVGWLVGLILMIMGVGVFVTRSHLTTARGVVFLCAAGAILAAGHFDLIAAHQATLVWTLAASILAASLFSIAFLFPYESSILYRLPWLRAIPSIAALAVFGICYLLFQQPETRAASLPEYAAGGFAGLAVLLLLGTMIGRRSRSPSSLAREQAGIVVLGVMIAATPLVLWMVSFVLGKLVGFYSLSFPSFYTLPTLILVPLSISYGLLQRRWQDSDRIISQSVIYIVLGVGLVLSYSFVTLALYLLTQGIVKWDSPLLVAITIFIIALVFSPTRARLESLVDRTFLKQRAEYETRVEGFARQLSLLVEVGAITKALRDQMDDTLKPQYMFIFLRNSVTGDYEAVADVVTGKPETDIHFAPGSVLLNYLSTNDTTLTMRADQPMPPELGAERSRLAVLNTPVIARLYSADRLNGFVALGPRRDRVFYGYEDLHFIENLTNQAALAYERAQVIVEAQRNERELKVLSQVSAALNITMDFDTLLEFIYAQADKVIRAANFYIVLRATSGDDLSFAFYQEDDERVTENEGVRFPMGRDLISEVVRTQRAFKTDHYSEEAIRRNTPPGLLNPELQAWMGVPLNAGTGVALGMVALSTDDTSVTYTDDQMRIFSNIADVAAAALEKARLFRETEERAQQLSILNGISNQLASQFENVDALLNTITQSALAMLRAEAGSLLLRDEQRGDLVFTLAIGGGGTNLVGTRIPPGSGIAGKVVETGQPVVVNDTSRDSNWFGEVKDAAKDHNAPAPTTFHTSSILAVPLIARGGVIGVLELINKRDGSRFVENDVNLLTTFGSQAAIAIENARLFQMTDQQLAERVQQLDNMQRIDQELNRTLNLHAVIDLTLDNAVGESHADAGALALVRTDPLGFEVVGSRGYPLGMFTPGEIYPIDMGVIGRVYRTGSASLVNELSDDPDYIETLPGAVGQLAVPMTSADKGVTAVLLLETLNQGTFNIMNLGFITALADHANTAITNSQLFAQLQQANAARTDFVAFVAHELKNPMTSIKGYSEVMLGGMTGTLTTQQRDIVAVVQRNVVRMQQIVEDLRDLTALETGKLTVKLSPTNFNNVIVETLRPQQRAIDEKQQDLVVNVPENLPLVMGDANRLIQVLTNFVSNANKYTPPGGTLTIAAEAVANQWEGDAGQGLVIHCQVIDTGIGMDDEDLKKLSTPYFRSKNELAQQQSGTGLGMTITYALIEAHGGTVWVESEINVGTSFHFTVPLAPETVKAR